MLAYLPMDYVSVYCYASIKVINPYIQNKKSILSEQFFLNFFY